MADDITADFTQINSELALFDPALAKKPQLVVLNKIDLPDVQEKWPALKKALTKKGYTVMSMSAVTHENLQAVLWKAFELLKTAPEVEVVEALIPLYKPEKDARDFVITREGEGWRVSGAAIERAAEMTYWEHDGSVRRFHHLMVTLGVDEALRKEGIEEGETVYIKDYELEWQD